MEIIAWCQWVHNGRAFAPRAQTHLWFHQVQAEGRWGVANSMAASKYEKK